MSTSLEERMSIVANGAFDEANDFQKLVVATGEWLERLFGPEAGNDAMRAAYEAVAPWLKADGETLPPDSTWRDAWTGLEFAGPLDVVDLPASQDLLRLKSYAFSGVATLRAETVEERAADLESTIRGLRSFLDAVPPNWCEITESDRVVRAAEARFRLDHGEVVTPDQLAALARVSLKSVKNLLAPSSGSGLALNEDGMVAASDALRWLMTREDFVPSVWRDERAVGAPSAADSTSANLGEVLFVPVAKDGSWFDPQSCRRAGRYTIGAKGQERSVDNYREALQELARMPTPYWRRPNKASHWGIVAGTGWARKPLSDLTLG